MATDTLYSLASSGPTNFDNDSAVNLGGEVVPTTTVWVTHLIRWRGTTNDSGTHTGQMFLSSDKSPVSGTAVTWTDVGTGWQEAAVSPPVQLTSGVAYVVAERCPNGGPAYESAYWTTGAGASGITSPGGLLTAPSSGSSTRGNGLYNNAGSLTCPDNTYNGNNYYLNLRVTDVDPNAASTAAASATGTATSTGARTAVASADAAASGTAAASGARTAVAAADASATGTASASGTRTATGLADASAHGDTAASGDRNATGTTAASATGTAAAAGFRGLFGSVAASAHGTASVATDSQSTAAVSAAGTAVATLHPVIGRPRRGTIHRP